MPNKALHFKIPKFIIRITSPRMSTKLWKNYNLIPADQGRSTFILDCIDHVNSSPYQLSKKDPITKIKAKILNQQKALKNNEVIGNKLYYYLRPTELTAPRFMFNQRYANQEFLYILLFHIVAPHCRTFTSTSLTFWKLMLKMNVTKLWEKVKNASFYRNSV